ncbi:type II secretion system protein GspL [Sphingobium sufflavum]|uniref:type II secretion system protein GspL n=1 Tax=Sphingobium sufflavum TaxID=1129547 RepID=UPI001F3B6D4B|nr:type II secretion system protein GspL [Sphingobium sufflavum]MCE7797498.1 type II secretion system protein GspL [Sphingobium sufflavum]
MTGTILPDGMIFWLSPDGGAAGGWLRVVGGHVVQRGGESGAGAGSRSGADWRAATGLVALPAGDTAMLIVPSGDAALHWIACPGMTVRQGAVAAPLMAVEASIGTPDTLHAAVAPALEPERPHIVAVAARDAMERWIGWCAAAGVPDAALVPAALLLPPVEDGFVAGRVGGEAVLRGTDCALGGGDAYAPLIVGDAPVRELDGATVEAGLVAALAAPPMDLRQGGYAVRAASAIDPAWVRRVAVLAGAVMLAGLLVTLVTVVRLHGEASSLDAATLALARDVVPEASDVADAEMRLAARVAAKGGAGGGFTGTAAGLLAAMQGAPGVTMTGLSQLADGTVRVQLAGPRPDDINVVLIALQNMGWRVAANSVQQQGAQTIADISVVPS